MATTPDAGVDLSDTDLDELVAAEFGEDSTSTTDPEPAAPAPTSNEADTPEEPTEPDTSLASTVADEETPDEDGHPAADDESETPAEPAAPAPPDLSQGKPFQFKASGGEHSLAGALELPDGSVVIPKESQAEFRQRLASQVELSTQFKATKRDYDRKLTAARTERTAKDVKADHIASMFEDVLNMNDDEAWDWIQQVKNDRPKIELEIQRKQLEAERQAYLQEKAGPEPTPEERQEQHVATVLPHLKTVFQQIMASPEAKTLTQAEATTIYNKYANNPRRLLSLIRTAEEDDPTSGLKKGEAYLEPEDIVEDFKIALSLKPKTPTLAAKRNAVLNADANVEKGKTPIPPTLRSGGKVVGTPGKKKETAWSKDAFMEGKLDDED